MWEDHLHAKCRDRGVETQQPSLEGEIWRTNIMLVKSGYWTIKKDNKTKIEVWTIFFFLIINRSVLYLNVFYFKKNHVYYKNLSKWMYIYFPFLKKKQKISRTAAHTAYS